MKKEKNNFTCAMEWLREHGKIKNQKDLADRIGVTETTVSRNKHGNVRRADEDTLVKFNAVFGDIINIAYLRGESDMMLVADLHQQKGTNTDVIPPVADASADLIAAIRDQLSDKERIIATQEALIESLQQQLSDLRTQLAMEKGLLTGHSPLAPADPERGQPCV